MLSARRGCHRDARSNPVPIEGGPDRPHEVSCRARDNITKPLASFHVTPHGNEDVGGPTGYLQYLEALANPEHPEHEVLLEWGPADFDPNKVNVADIAIRLTDLAMRWQRKP